MQHTSNPVSPLNSESNGLEERHVGIAKNLLKKCIESKEDYMVAVSALNTMTRVCGFSPAEMLLKIRIRMKLPDIRGQPNLDLASQSREDENTKMREILRKNKAKPAQEVWEIVLLYEEMG